MKDEVLVLPHIGSKEHCGGVAVTCLPGNAWTKSVTPSPFFYKNTKQKQQMCSILCGCLLGSLDTSVKINPCSAGIQNKN